LAGHGLWPPRPALLRGWVRGCGPTIHNNARSKWIAPPLTPLSPCEDAWGEGAGGRAILTDGHHLTSEPHRGSHKQTSSRAAGGAAEHAEAGAVRMVEGDRAGGVLERRAELELRIVGGERAGDHGG